MVKAKRGNNEGSIYQRSDGRWVGSVTIAGGGRVSQQRKYIYGKTRQEVARKLTETLKSVQDNAPLPPDRLTVAGFAKQWLESVKPSLRFKTFESYDATLRVHVIPALGHIRLARLSAANLERLYADLSEKGPSPKSVLNYHRCIHAMLEKAVRWGILVRNVAKLASLPRQVHQELPMVSPQQTRTFLQAAREHRLEALFVLAITTGARQGELLGLTWDRVLLDDSSIEVRQALQKQNGRPILVEPKTSRSVRTIALTGIAVDALRLHWANQMKEAFYLGPNWDNPLNLAFTTSVGTPLDKDNVTKRELRSVLKGAGLPSNLRFHDLRHIAASLTLSNGTPLPVVSEMLGHSDPATTLRVYAHVIPGARRQAAKALETMLTG